MIADYFNAGTMDIEFFEKEIEPILDTLGISPEDIEMDIEANGFPQCDINSIIYSSMKLIVVEYTIMLKEYVNDLCEESLSTLMEQHDIKEDVEEFRNKLLKTIDELYETTLESIFVNYMDSYFGSIFDDFEFTEQDDIHLIIDYYYE